MLLTREQIEDLLRKPKLSLKEMIMIAKTALTELGNYNDIHINPHYFSTSEYLKSDILKDNLTKINKYFNQNIDELLNFRPLTVVEYWKSETVYKRLVLQKFSDKFKLITKPFSTNGYYLNSELIIFASNYSRRYYIDSNHQLIGLLKTTFHEFSHAMQSKKFDELSLFEKTIFLVEDFILQNDNKWYHKFWGVFFTESQANFRGFSYAKAFLNRFSYFTNQNKEYINNLDKMYNCHYKTYDFNLIFKKFHKLNKKKKKQAHFSNISEILYADTESCKFKDIASLRSFMEGSEILYYILASEPYIKQLDFSSLTVEELEIMNQAINFVCEKEKEKIKLLGDCFSEDYPKKYKKQILAFIRPILKQQPFKIKFLKAKKQKIEIAIGKKLLHSNNDKEQQHPKKAI